MDYTKNLNLYKIDPVKDSDHKFDIDKILNDNWDKIDKAFEVNKDELKVVINNLVGQCIEDSIKLIIKELKEYTDMQIGKITNNALIDLNSLRKISDSINNDPEYYKTVQTIILNRSDEILKKSKQYTDEQLKSKNNI